MRSLNDFLYTHSHFHLLLSKFQYLKQVFETLDVITLRTELLFMFPMQKEHKVGVMLNRNMVGWWGQCHSVMLDKSKLIEICIQGSSVR